MSLDRVWNFFKRPSKASNVTDGEEDAGDGTFSLRRDWRVPSRNGTSLGLRAFKLNGLRSKCV
jgi:hypothetical protein